MTTAPDSSSPGAQVPRSSPRQELRASGRRAKKSLGQHFLNDHGVVQKIIAAADLTAADTVIEVGPKRVLSVLVLRINKGLRVLNVENLESLQRTEEVLSGKN